MTRPSRWPFVRFAKALVIPALITFAAVLLSTCDVSAQSNPVPLINQPLEPDTTAPGGQALTLTVDGTGFVRGSTVRWNGSALATTYVSGSQLIATVPASDIASAQTASVTVENPGVGASSNWNFLQVANSETALSFSDSQISTSGTLESVITGDFNGDGIPDLVFATQAGTGTGTGDVWVILGSGNGTFGQATMYPLNSAPYFIAAGDFNGDGNLDIVVPAVSENGNGDLSVLLGNGNGTFGSPIVYQTTNSGLVPNHVAVADFNRDGVLDVAASTDAGISIFLGNGDGTFSTENDIYIEALWGITTGDFIGDGLLDLAAADLSDSKVNILLGNGDGTFQSPTAITTAEAAEVFVTTADVNNDGELDLIAGGDGTQVSVLLGNGNGTFQPYVGYSTGPEPVWVATGDFNADGTLDLAVANGGANTVSVLLGNGNGTFQEHLDFGTALSPICLGAGDFNGDGLLDLVSASTVSTSLSILAQQGAVTLSPTTLTFPTQVIGTRSVPLAVTLSNESGSALAISGVNVSGANPGDFSQTNTCGSSVPPGGSCTINVTFDPTGQGTRQASVTLEDGGPGGGPSFSVLGTGTEAKLEPRQINFGSVPVGTKSAAQTVTLTNVGTAALALRKVGLGGNYQEFAERDHCPRSLPAGQSCTVTVVFQPQQSGSQFARLGVQNNGTGGYVFQFVGLSGIGAE